MSDWTRFFRRQRDLPAGSTSDSSRRRAPAPQPTASAASANPETGDVISELDQITFLEGLLEVSPACPVEALTNDDRAFLDGIDKLWRAQKLELPVMSQAALRLTELLRAGEAPLHQYAQLVASDSALTVEVLRAANSAAFAAPQPVTHLDDAIRRVGLSRLGSILIMAQMKKKVLAGGAVTEKATLLMDLVSPLGMLAADLTAAAGGDAQVAFMRGALFHVEHLVILGAVSEVSRERRETIRPSVDGLLHAFARFGPGIRQAVATSWGLEHILLGADGEPNPTATYFALRRAVVSRWLNRPLPEPPNVDAARLERGLARVLPRVKETIEIELTTPQTPEELLELFR